MDNTRRAARRAATRGLLLLAGTLLAGLWSCEYPEGEQYGNSAPETRLANIPANDTIALYILQGTIPQQTLYWLGDDQDGFVVAYQYRWIDFAAAGPDTNEWTTAVNLTNLTGTTLDTLILAHPRARSPFRIYNFLATIADQSLINAIQDSLGLGRWFAVPYPSGPVEFDSLRGADPLQVETPTKGTFIFNSNLDSNQHRFEVRSIDNNDVVDPTPAAVNFWTLRSPGPIVFFTGGPPNNQYVLRCPTVRSPGLVFTSGGIDPSTEERYYAWSVDDSVDWSAWSEIPRFTVTASMFRETGSDTHWVYLKGKNRWDVESAIAARRFTAKVPPIDDPAWPHRTLVLNNTRAIGSVVSRTGPVDTNFVKETWTAFMAGVGKTDSADYWTAASQPSISPWPGLDVLVRYTCLVVVMENTPPPIGGGSFHRIDIGKQDLMRRYMAVGGRLIWSGTPNIRSSFNSYEGWAADIIHATRSIPYRQNDSLDFVGMKGMNGYPDILLDSAVVAARLPVDPVYPGVTALRGIAVNYPYGFAQAVGSFDSQLNLPLFEDVPMAVRYIGGGPDPGEFCRQTFSVVHFAFPLTFCRQADVIAALRVAFRDLNESSLP
ncbi:MAG: hypothetical protein WB626_10035 [Bacteroidota bacterium]